LSWVALLLAEKLVFVVAVALMAALLMQPSIGIKERVSK
jgi:hypothetical protein